MLTGTGRHKLLENVKRIRRARKPKHPLLAKLLTKSEINALPVCGLLLLLGVVLIFRPPAFEAERWHLYFDMNRNGLFTISDVLRWFVWLFYFPGDFILQILMEAHITRVFFELSAESYGNIGSLLLSVICWWICGGPTLVFLMALPVIITHFF